MKGMQDTKKLTSPRPPPSDGGESSAACGFLTSAWRRQRSARSGTLQQRRPKCHRTSSAADESRVWFLHPKGMITSGSTPRRRTCTLHQTWTLKCGDTCGFLFLLHVGRLLKTWRSAPKNKKCLLTMTLPMKSIHCFLCSHVRSLHGFKT